jgi:hypothetical protein
MANNSEEGQGSQRAVVPVMIMMIMMMMMMMMMMRLGGDHNWSGRQ